MKVTPRAIAADLSEHSINPSEFDCAPASAAMMALRMLNRPFPIAQKGYREIPAPQAPGLALYSFSAPVNSDARDGGGNVVAKPLTFSRSPRSSADSPVVRPLTGGHLPHRCLERIYTNHVVVPPRLKVVYLPLDPLALNQVDASMQCQCLQTFFRTLLRSRIVMFITFKAGNLLLQHIHLDSRAVWTLPCMLSRSWVASFVWTLFLYLPSFSS